MTYVPKNEQGTTQIEVVPCLFLGIDEVSP